MLIDQENGIEDSATTKPRILIILFRDNSGHLFHLAEQNNTFVLTYLDLFADDPYQSISIKKGILGIEFYYYPFSGNWLNRHSYQFSYQKKEFLLIGAEYEESNKATHDFNKYSYNFIQNKRLFSTGNWDRKTKKTEAISLKNPGRQTLKSLQRPYNWEVEPGVYL